MAYIVKRFLNLNDISIPVSSGASVPVTGTLVMAPNIYSLSGQGPWDMFDEGRYVIWNTAVGCAQRIVYQSDIYALMSALCWISVNGDADENLTNAQKTSLATSSKLRMLCGKTVSWAKSVTDSLGITSRIVNALTAETPNNYYDGHVMLEVLVNGQWVLFDVANDCTYDNLPLKDALPVLPATVRNALAPDIYSTEPSGGNFDVTAWQEMTMRTTAQKNAEVERVLQIPGITDPNGHTYFYIPDGIADRTAWILSLSSAYHVMTKTAWLAKYYP